MDLNKRQFYVFNRDIINKNERSVRILLNTHTHTHNTYSKHKKRRNRCVRWETSPDRMNIFHNDESPLER